MTTQKHFQECLQEIRSKMKPTDTRVWVIYYTKTGEEIEQFTEEVAVRVYPSVRTVENKETTPRKIKP